MNKNTQKGAIGEGKSLEEGGLIQQDTRGGIEHTRKNNTNTRDNREDWTREIDKNEFKGSYKDYNKSLKKEGGNKWVQKL